MAGPTLHYESPAPPPASPGRPGDLPLVAATLVYAGLNVLIVAGFAGDRSGSPFAELAFFAYYGPPAFALLVGGLAIAVRPCPFRPLVLGAFVAAVVGIALFNRLCLMAMAAAA